VAIKKTHAQVIEDFTNRHGNLYDYSLVKYENGNTPVDIICAAHGIFKQRPRAHMSGQICPVCQFGDRWVPSHTTESYLTKAKATHNNKYEYEEFSYKNLHQTINIKCPLHGSYKTTTGRHINNKTGCPNCAGNKTKTTAQFISESQSIHNNTYDYSKSIYNNANTKVTIICRAHGDFKQRPIQHTNGQGCPKCGFEKAINAIRKPQNDFIKECSILHNNRYDYDKTEYINNKSHIIITCKTHGDFTQRAQDHLHGDGCSKCSNSIEQEDISNQFLTFSNNMLRGDKKIIKPYELDIYFPDQKIAIEYNGDYWHSFNKIETTTQRNKHKHKTDMCNQLGIKLYQFGSFEWHYKKDIIMSMLNHKFQKDQKIAARKCYTTIINNQQAKEFFNNTHISGHRPAYINIGLYHQNELVSCINFNKYAQYYEIIRYSTKLNHTVVGGLSKLLSHFISLYKPHKLMTYADRRYGSGDGYLKIGFKHVKTTQPGYVYLNKHTKKCYSRITFQKHKLITLLNIFDPSITEAENMFNNGYRRLWDAGHNKYEMVL
jgi:hypothetical protein